MRLYVGNNTFEIPEHLIDFDDFAEVAIREVPDALKRVQRDFRGLDVEVKQNWSSKDFRKIGKRLKSYQEVENIARQAGCNATSALAIALADLYINGQIIVHTDVVPMWDQTEAALLHVHEKYMRVSDDT